MIILLTLCVSLAFAVPSDSGGKTSEKNLPCGFDAVTDEMYPGWSEQTGALSYPVKHGELIAPQCGAYGLTQNKDVKGLVCVNGKFMVVKKKEKKKVDIESIEVCNDPTRFRGEEETSEVPDELNGVTVEHVTEDQLKMLFEKARKEGEAHCDDKATHEQCGETSGCFWDHQDDRCEKTAVLVEQPIDCHSEQMDAFINCLIAGNCDEEPELKKTSGCFKDMFHFWENERLNEVFAKADLEHSGHLGFPYEVDLFCKELGVACPELQKNLEDLNERVTKKFLYRYLGHLSTELDDAIWKMERRIFGDEEEHLFEKKEKNAETWESYEGPLVKAKFGETCGRCFFESKIVQRVCEPALVCDPRWKFCGDNPVSYVGDETRDVLDDLEFHHVYSDGGLILVEAGSRPSLDQIMSFVGFGAQESRRELFVGGVIDWFADKADAVVGGINGIKCNACKAMHENAMKTGFGVGCGFLAAAGCAAASVPTGGVLWPACTAALTGACAWMATSTESYLTTGGQYPCGLYGLCPMPRGSRKLFNSQGCIQSEHCPGKYWHVKSGSDFNGNQVHLWGGCGNRNSRWIIEDQQIKKIANRGRCIHKGMSWNYNGNELREWGCNGHGNSKFVYEPDERKLYTVDDMRYVIHKRRSTCSNGNRIHQYKNSGGTSNWNELWGTP